MIACLRLPYFAAALVQLKRPALETVPFILVEPPEQAQFVWAVSPLAAEAGIQPGMMLGQAEALCRDLHSIPAARTHFWQSFEELLETLTLFTPNVEPEDGFGLRAGTARRKTPLVVPPSPLGDPSAAIAYLELGTLAQDDARDLARQMRQVVWNQVHLLPAIGLASGKFTAWVVATSLQPGETFLLRQRQEAQFLAEVPVTLLPVDDETIRQLALLGLDTLGQVAALPVPALLNRFGPVGRTMHQLARGDDNRPVAAYAPNIRQHSTHQFDPPVKEWAVLMAVAAQAVDSLVAILQSDHHLAREIELTLALEDGCILERRRVMRQPSASPRHITQVATDLLQTIQVPCGVIALTLTLSGITPAVAHPLSLFPHQPARQEQRQQVLAGLMTRYGDAPFYQVWSVDPTALLLERRYRVEKVTLP